jgi:hypothetical protein
MTIVFRPHIPTGLVVSQLLDPLLAELRHHNKVSSPAAQIQLRLALHAGLVTRDANGFAGQAAIHLFRIIEAPSVKRELAVSGADLALIASDYVYDNFISDTHGSVNPDTYTRVKVNVKKTRTHAWYRLAGGPPLRQARSANGQTTRAAGRRNLCVLGITDGQNSWWGGWGSNPRPADYEKYGLVHRTHHLHGYHETAPPMALIALFAPMARSTNRSTARRWLPPILLPCVTSPGTPGPRPGRRVARLRLEAWHGYSVAGREEAAG